MAEVIIQLHVMTGCYHKCAFLGEVPYSLQISSPFNFRLEGGKNWRERILKGQIWEFGGGGIKGTKIKRERK